MRAPVASPRLSLPRNFEADAHAAWTKSISLWFAAGMGSCQVSSSGGTSRPRERAGARVAVGQLEPRRGERVREVIRMLQQAP